MRTEPSRTRFPAPTVLRSLLAVAVLAAILSLGTAAIGSDPVDAADPLYTLEVTPTAGLVDGQAISVRLNAAPGRRIGVSGKLSICRVDATYETTEDLIPFVGGKCPDKPVSSSASGPWPIRALPDGSAAIATMRVGTGLVQWGPEGDPDQFSLTCDPSNPCRLVVDFQIEGGPRIIDSSVVLSFADSSPISTCGGVRDDAISTGGSDRMLSAWIAWTRAQCVAEGAKASTQAVLAGEGDGLRTFGEGQTDLVYSGVGTAFPGEEAPRNGVPVPVGLNAAVVGVLGGYGSNDPDWPSGVPRSYDDVRVTMPELATLFGKGPFLFDATYLGDLQARNAELARGDSLTNPGKFNPLAPAAAEASSYYASAAFDALAAPQWRTPPLNITGNPPDVDRGVHPSFALANPPFVQSLFELYSAQSQLKRVVADNEFKPFNYGPIWVLTDLATARDLGIPTVSVQNSRGEFVRPTEASLEAAAATLVEQDDGSFAPDIGNDAPGAYPLTFVEHAVVPAEPLLAEDCSPRAGAQATLAGWLEYVTGPGQAAIPAGMAPLTPALATAADEAIAMVGTAAVTGDCAPEDPNEEPPPSETPSGTPGDLPGGSFGGLGGSFGGASTSGFGGLLGRATAAGTTGTGGSGSVGVDDASSGSGDGSDESANAELIAEIEQPGLPAGSSSGWVTGAVSILGLAVLGALGGKLSAGRRVPGAPGSGW